MFNITIIKQNKLEKKLTLFIDIQLLIKKRL